MSVIFLYPQYFCHLLLKTLQTSSEFWRSLITPHRGNVKIISRAYVHVPSKHDLHLHFPPVRDLTCVWGRSFSSVDPNNGWFNVIVNVMYAVPSNINLWMGFSEKWFAIKTVRLHIPFVTWELKSRLKNWSLVGMENLTLKCGEKNCC